MDIGTVQITLKHFQSADQDKVRVLILDGMRFYKKFGFQRTYSVGEDIYFILDLQDSSG